MVDKMCSTVKILNPVKTDTESPVKSIKKKVNYYTAIYLNRIFIILLLCIIISSSIFFNTKLQDLHETSSLISKQEEIARKFQPPKDYHKDLLKEVKLLREKIQKIEDKYDKKIRKVEDDLKRFAS